MVESGALREARRGRRERGWPPVGSTTLFLCLGDAGTRSERCPQPHQREPTTIPSEPPDLGNSPLLSYILRDRRVPSRFLL